MTKFQGTGEGEQKNALADNNKEVKYLDKDICIFHRQHSTSDLAIWMHCFLSTIMHNTNLHCSKQKQTISQVNKWQQQFLSFDNCNKYLQQDRKSFLD